jgi:hypothetical protein
LTEEWQQIDFSYIIDPRLREIIEMFHANAVSAYRQENYVAAVVLAGGALEGLLTFALKRREDRAREEYKKLQRRAREIDDWTLVDLVGIAVKLGSIGEGPGKAADALRDFRNLIHPYKLVRRSRPQWTALAVMALAAVAEVSRSLRGRMEA